MTKLYLERVDTLIIEHSLIEFKVNTEYRLKNYIEKLEKSTENWQREYYESLIKIQQDKLESINKLLKKL